MKRLIQLTCLLAITIAIFFSNSCKKDLKEQSSAKNTIANLLVIKQEFSKQNITSRLVSPFDDSLNLVYNPDWDNISEKGDANINRTTYFVPLVPRLKSISSGNFFNVQQVGAKQMIINRDGSNYDFNIAIYSFNTGQSNGTPRTKFSSTSTDTVFSILIEGRTGNYLNKYQKLANKYEHVGKTSTVGRSEALLAPSNQICYQVCTWGYYCPSTGYHVTVTVSDQYFCNYPSPDAACTLTGPSYSGGVFMQIPVWDLGHTEQRCITGPPPNSGTFDPDPTHWPTTGGTYTSAVKPSIDFPKLPNLNDLYRYTCPSNFTFISVTEHDLWQEAAITNATVNLEYIDMGATPPIIKHMTVTIPILYFGLCYFDVNGKLLLTRKDAAAISADALNSAEFRVRKAFGADPLHYTSAQLQQIWIEQADYYMKKLSKNLGKCTTTGSFNPAQVVVPRPYTGCD